MAAPMPPAPLLLKGKDDAATTSGPTGEGPKRAREPPTELDVTFCLDCTLSMKPYITSAQQNICAITEALVAYEKCDVRFGLVAYRDHAPVCPTFLTKKFDFTSSTSRMRQDVHQLGTGTGGDESEAVCCALYEALNMDWRKGSTKVVIFVTDAPPHGLGEYGDSFPNGCPDGHDPLETARKMAEQGICLYTVGCEPQLSCSYHRFAKDFMVAIAEITGGQAVSLSSSRHLVDVILGSTQEELTLEVLMSQFDLEKKSALTSIGNARVSQGKTFAVKDKNDADFEEYQAEVVKTVHSSMSSRGVETKQFQHDGQIEAPHAKDLMSVANLKEWRAIQPKLQSSKMKPSLSIPASRVSVSVGVITSQQVQRMAGKSASRTLRPDTTK